MAARRVALFLFTELVQNSISRSGFTLWQESQSGCMSDANAPERSEGNGHEWPLPILATAAILVFYRVQ